jgi:hypothetical protein
MVIPPVVVVAGETDRAIRAAVVISTAMWLKRDKSEILKEPWAKDEGRLSTRQPS